MIVFCPNCGNGLSENKKLAQGVWELKRKIHHELDQIISNSGHMHYKRNFIDAGVYIAALATEMAKVMQDFTPEEYD